MELSLYLISIDDQVYESDVLRDPGSIKPWLRYTDHKARTGSPLERSFVLERACHALPRSYKLWKMYLELRVKNLRNLNSAKYNAEFAKVNSLFEKALILLNKMPRIWEMYLSHLMKQPKLTAVRRVFDRSLRALPVTQHQRIWKLYKRFAVSAAGDTATKIWRRYVQLHPEDLEDFVDLLIEQGNYTEAAQKYLQVLDNHKFRSKHGKGRFQLWTELADLLVARAREVDFQLTRETNVEEIFRSGINLFADQRGRLWTSLATFWVRKGDFERARDAFEEAITTSMTLRDFTMVFDAYLEFEESVTGSLMEAAATRSAEGLQDLDADFDLDIRMLRFEQLMNRRPFLVNDVLLRQNPSNVNDWEKRISLWGDNMVEIVQTYTDAIKAIQPRKAVGKFHDLWLNYAKFYETAGDLASARVILEKAVKVPFKSVAEVAETWCGWAELELRNNNFEGAIKIMIKATQAPKRSHVDYFDESLSPQQRVHKSWKLWSFYVDLVESVGSLEDTRKVYDRIFELRIATPQTVVNNANLLEEHQYYEESFKVYERGLDLFKYPVAFELWNLYLTKAVDRRISIERLRDLFEQALEGCPPRFAKPIFLMYADLEKDRGLARHAMRIYERATRAVADEDRLDTFKFYINQSASNFGLTSTRPIYQRAIEILPDQEAKDMCLKFAEMERRLGEIDRARAIYGHGSQFSDPRTNPTYWQKWESFEIQHGNEDTFMEMRRIMRSVQARYNTDVNFIASQALARSQQVGDRGLLELDSPDTDGPLKEREDAMVALERQAKAPLGFVAASSGPEGGSRISSDSVGASKVDNPDAIYINIDDM